MKNNLLLALAAGLFGGVISHYLFTVPLVYAQNPMKPPKEVRAQSFTLMNDRGQVGGTFAFDDDGRPMIRLFENGRMTWSLGGKTVRPLAGSR